MYQSLPGFSLIYAFIVSQTFDSFPKDFMGLRSEAYEECSSLLQYKPFNTPATFNYGTDKKFSHAIHLCQGWQKQRRQKLSSQRIRYFEDSFETIYQLLSSKFPNQYVFHYQIFNPKSQFVRIWLLYSVFSTTTPRESRPNLNAITRFHQFSWFSASFSCFTKVFPKCIIYLGFQIVRTWLTIGTKGIFFMYSEKDFAVVHIRSHIRRFLYSQIPSR